MLLKCSFFVMIFISPTLVRCECSTQSLAASINCAGLVNATPFETVTPGEEATGSCECMSVVTLCYNNSSTSENCNVNSECDQTIFKFLTIALGIVSFLLLGILTVVVLYQVCHNSAGLGIFRSGSQRRASTGINEAYGILEDVKCTGLPGTTCPEQLQTEVDLVTSQQDNELSIIRTSSQNSAYSIVQEPNANDTSPNAGYLPVLSASSLPLPTSAVEYNDDDGEIEYAYTETRFASPSPSSTNLNTATNTADETNEISIDRNIAYGSIEIVQETVQEPEKKVFRKSYDTAISATPQLLLVQRAKKGMKTSQSSPSVPSHQNSSRLYDVKAENRVSALAQRFENSNQ